MRPDKRQNNALRPVEMTVGFHKFAEGSVLYRAGSTLVLCTASIDDKVPPFLEGKGKGWITAEYQMHPRSNPVRREQRDGRGKAPSGRTQEIQRLVGRALRAAIDLDNLGERQVTIDCDVLEADGGTRTASITGGFVALAIAIDKLRKSGKLEKRVLRDSIAATSVGCVEKDELALDLVYLEDSKARVDLNVVATGKAAIVEIQGTAEGEPVARSVIDSMVDLALEGIVTLTHMQRTELTKAGIDLDLLLVKSPAQRAGATEK